MNRPQKIADLDGVRPPQFSDDALALRFAERYGDELRYVAKWSQWLRWTGTR
jgi:putative DNA primase/helicase